MAITYDPKTKVGRRFSAENDKKIMTDDSYFQDERNDIIDGLADNNEFNNLKIKENKENNIVRACRFCLYLKADRMRHCRDCKKCFLKSDHHCYFINNCIGFKNYKYFFCFLFYTIVQCSTLKNINLACQNVYTG